MALRDLVTGSDACTPGDGAGPSNAAASLAEALFGRRSKQQAQLHELPGVQQPAPFAGPLPFQPQSAAQAAEAAVRGTLPAVHGLSPGDAHATDVDAFLRGLGSPQEQLEGRHELTFQEFDSIYGAVPTGHAAAAAAHQMSRAAVRPFLQAFFRSGGGALAPPHSAHLPAVDLSVGDKCRIRDRSTILARQVFADRGNAFADEQVGRLLHSLNIDPAALPTGADATLASWERIYQGAPGTSVATEQAAAAAMAHAADGRWVDEFQAMHIHGEPSHTAVEIAPEAAAWAADFAAKQGVAGAAPVAGWANEFRAAADAGTSARRDARSDGDALEQTRRLAGSLSSSQDPKIKNSKFLQFVSKMSRGELILEDNGVREVPREAAAWVDDFARAQQPSSSRWGEEFASFQAAQQPGERWAAEFGGAGAPAAADWASQFADGVVDGWAEDFAGGRPGSTDVAQWEEEYARELQRLHSEAGPRATGAYVMADNNPFLTDADSFVKGKDLFKRGILSEAVVALEAECQRSPGNAEAWRLLGTVQAENDDDVQAIAAMNRALAVDPGNLDVLLSLGVSHTNELEQGRALEYLREWLTRHPEHGPAARAAPAPPDSSQTAGYTVRLFQEAARASPRDADVAAALGVLCNLTRRYDEAVAAFRAALALRPQDYSLWNKLGATLANSARSSEAIAAYQKALELKPNYMRAWTNMGISLANIGEYEGSAKYYIRALSLNRRAAAVWSYLRTSLACAGRQDLAVAAEGEELEALQRALPL